ncbi:N-acetylglucosaminyldiphosphoundecaprenol N-acetyl-beta-D-mannosaminyltransferase [Salinibacillus kushneri]|uniref:N-acetylglucosaminyldiphosphoundecaprenol N-acetyl-beta-D-mannosaminyltransferase n=1 Tax=Salinibacillus kushneri TaxID=237682 RepID=A0A1I0JGQ0_9BACI|nr:WecB/TagA/CpsF family glycosyltransferase [Salinibacillus kushneri]SEU09388.1 N-acetylglucosaminyldiphosphoundecaprenol N-acetyl-beta-D-mannosaminyltransferase [Salinibacillus kushneri]
MPNTENIIKIMDIPLFNINKEDLISFYIHPDLLYENKRFMVTANPEIVMRTREDKKYKRAIQTADYIIPDGAGIIVASKIMGQPIKERIPGIEMMTHLIEYAEEKGLTCYFLGAKDGVVQKMIYNLKAQYPKIKIAGYNHGYISLDNQEVVNEIKSLRPDLVFVALGFPKQEKWIARHYHEFDKGLFMGVGGSFDIFGGEAKRAPEGWIKLNLEWFYRLLKQPFRWKRIIKVFEFLFRIILRKY